MIAEYFADPSLVQPRRVRCLEVRAGALLRLVHMLDGKRIFKVQGLPEDARAIAITVANDRPDVALLYLESSQFAEIGEGWAVPRMDLSWTEIHPSARMAEYGGSDPT